MMSPDDRAHNAINTLFDDVQAAWAANDAERFAQVFSEDAIFVPFNGARLLGRAAIANFHAPPFATVFQGSRLLFDLIDIRPLSETLYLVATSGSPTRPGQKNPVQGTQSYIFQDFGDRWAITFFQNTPVLPLPGTP
jgi:uncharacterized protein (TIGR02246 family)